MQRSRSADACHGNGTTPVRTCIGCRRRALIGELLRVVATDGRLAVDTRRRLPGRGAWLHPSLDCLSAAERRRAFPRALRVQGSPAVEAVRQHLEQLADQNEDPGRSRVQSEPRKQVDPS
nr:YlxR family protein [Prauserella marina]